MHKQLLDYMKTTLTNKTADDRQRDKETEDEVNKMMIAAKQNWLLEYQQERN